MLISERIELRVRQLPVAFQAEVLDFTEYLFAKSIRQEERDWENLSLAFAMRGMEQETYPIEGADLEF